MDRAGCVNPRRRRNGITVLGAVDLRAKLHEGQRCRAARGITDGISSHVQQRMGERFVSETQLRQIWGNAAEKEVRLTKTRMYAVSGRISGKEWEIVVKPLERRQRLLIVTVYEKEQS